MPSKSDIISLDGVAIPTGVTGNIDVTSEDPTVDPAYQDRIEAPSFYLATTRPATDLIAILKCDTYARQAATLSWLGFPRNADERVLRVYGGDPASPIAVTTPVTVRDVRVEAGQVTATLRRGDIAWESITETTEGPTAFAASGTTTFTVGGELPVNPLIKIGWSVQRATSSATNGWKYRKRIAVTNNSPQSLHNQVIQLGPINTAALIAAGKLQTDCDDLVIFNERGERQRCRLYGANSRGSFFTFTVDELAAGSTRTYDLCYGNPNAAHSFTDNGFPYEFAGSPAIDITGIDGQATGGTVSTLSTGVTLDANQFLGGTILLTGASTAIGGQYRRISSHTTGGVFTPTRNFSTAPDTTTGYVILSGPFMGDGGQASSTSATSLTDAAQTWNPGEWIGATVESLTLTTTMGTVGQAATVTSNTATTLTMSGGWPAAPPSGTTLYRVYKRNANYVYRVEQVVRSQNNHRGRWRLNKGTNQPSQIWFASDGAPHAWSPTIYNPGNANNDFNQKRVRDVDIGGGDKDYFAVLDASLAKKDSQRFRDEGFANGVSISIPLGILGVRQDYQVQNPNGMARVYLGYRESGGEDWTAYHEYSTTQASLTTRPVAYYDLTTSTPLHLINALTSDDDADIEKEQTGVARLIDATVMEVRVDARNLVVSNPDDVTEESVYDMTLLLRRSTSASETAGDDVIRIGQSEKHLFIASGEKLWIGQVDDIPLVCRLYNGSTYVRDVPWPVGIYHVENNRSGVATRYVSSDVLPLNAGSQTIRVSDPDGTQGTIDLTVVYRASYA
jgi:hypothetical protein